MKAGAEVHFLAGQIFTLGIAAVAVVPRLPSNDRSSCTIGGKLSYPFRRALLVLVAVGVIRVVSCHLIHQESTALRTLDGILGTIFVVGESFLCLTTAYLLQCQLSDLINIGVPGRSLLSTLIAVFALTVLGAALSEIIHPNFWCLVNLAEVVSCFPVIKTLKLYASITTVGEGHHSGRGPILTQSLLVIEHWYLVTSLLSFIAEALDDVHDNDNNGLEGRPIQLFLQAIRHNQDNGVDDWSRLLLHSVFLNSIDELQHFTSGVSSSTSSSTATGNNNESATPAAAAEDATPFDFLDSDQKALALRKRIDHTGV